jgi:NADPH-dependent 2,4-dienoyl-CoA reductase/sulfur reductase-like enzyme
MADPHIARKIAEGREAEIRPCVGMGYCIDSIYAGQAVCIHNPATGREATIPHLVPRSNGPKRKVVVVGAGPGGLEAARVAGERGHDVVVLEAAARPGGQIVLAAALKRRREIIGVVDWRMREGARLGVAFRFNAFAGADDVLGLDPDVVVIATGGAPNIEFLDSGDEFAVTSWDLLSGAARPSGEVIVYDDNGAHPGLSAAEYVADSGAKLEIVTPERMLAPDVGGTSYPPYFRAFSRADAKVSLNLRLESIARRGNRVVGAFYDEYGRRRVEKEADMIVVEHGAVPVDDLYFELKAGSINRGEVDYDALIAGRPQTVSSNPDGRYRLFRIGDAVASRNIHAAVYDAIRLMKDI